MFRKGGDVGGGIMDNVVERGQYAESNAKDFKGLSIEDKINLVEGLGGPQTGLNDPLTQFLLAYGPALATQTGAGSTIGNIVAAAKGPTADLLKDARSQRKTRQAIGLEFIKDLSDDDKIALQEQIEYLMSPEGGGFTKEEAFNRLKPEFRKRRDPKDQAALDTSSTIDSIIRSTQDSRGNPKIDSLQAEIIVDNLKDLEKSNPDAYSKFVGAKSKSKYIFGQEGEYTPEGDIIKDSILADLPDGYIVYDVNTARFLKKQGNKVIEVVSVTEE